MQMAEDEPDSLYGYDDTTEEQESYELTDLGDSSHPLEGIEGDTSADGVGVEDPVSHRFYTKPSIDKYYY